MRSGVVAADPGQPEEGKIAAAGSLPAFHQPTPRKDLNHLSLVDLSAELLTRLTAGASYAGSTELVLGEQLAQALTRRLDVHLNRFSARRHRDLLGPIVSYVSQEDLKHATVVDLGCGGLNPYTFSFILLMLGAERAYAIDLEPIQDVEVAVRAMADAAGWLLLQPARVLGGTALAPEDVLANLKGFQLPLLAAGDPAGIAPGRLVHRIDSVHNLSLSDEAADLVCSVSLLEHLDRVDDALDSLRRITRRGGLGIHVIDFVDHRIYSGQPFRHFDFLKDDSADPLVFGSNRIRCDEFCQLFEKHGFSVERADRWAHLPAPTAEDRAQFVEPFRSMPAENLATTGARIFARRR